MLLSVVLVTLFVRLFINSYKAQLVGAMLTLSLPMGIVQSTTTQTDYLAGFFLLTFLYFMFIIVRERPVYLMPNIAFATLALGLGMLTKLTVALFAFPFCVWFAVLVIRRHRCAVILPAIIGGLITISINAPFYSRNLSLTNNLVGSEELSTM